MDTRVAAPEPKCIASTLSTYQCTISESHCRESAEASGSQEDEPRKARLLSSENESNYFQQAQWSADGTTLLTTSADNRIRTFIAPPDLLEPHPSPIHLKPYTITSPGAPTYALTLHPSYTLSSPTSTLYLSSHPSHPLALRSTLSPTLLSSYPLIHAPTESHLPAYSLLIPPSAPHTFLAGHTNAISLFNLHHPGAPPLATYPTIPSARKKLVGGGVGMKGIVSCLDLAPTTNILAVGTFTRSIGLYDACGAGDTIAVFTLPPGNELGIGGQGVTQLLWSPCGRYLFVAERGSDGVLLYDIRGTGRLLGELVGRQARTNQRLGVHVVGTDAGVEVWAGGIDGVVRVWRDAQLGEGRREAAWSFRAGEDPITSTVVHPSGCVVATCSGQRQLSRQFADEDEDSESEESGEESSGSGASSSVSSSFSSSGSLLSAQFDNTLKIWSL